MVVLKSAKLFWQWLERSIRIKTKGNYPAHTQVIEL